jgi:uncharacterized protein
MKKIPFFICVFYLVLFSNIQNNQIFLSNFAISEIMVGKDKFLNMEEQLVNRENTFYEKFKNAPYTGLAYKIKLFDTKNKIGVILLGFIKKGTMEGKWRVYGVQNKIIDSGVLHAEKSFSNNKANGLWKFFSGKNINATEYYVDDKLHGESISYYPSGQLSDKTTYRNDKRDGLSISYHENGQLFSKVIYKEGKPIDQKEIIFYPNGIKKSEVMISNGERHGIYNRFYKSGKLEVKGTYFFGKNDGIWHYYFETGIVKEITKYNMNKTQNHSTYFTDGKLKNKFLYKNNKIFCGKSYKEDGTLEYDTC